MSSRREIEILEQIRTCGLMDEWDALIKCLSSKNQETAYRNEETEPLFFAERIEELRKYSVKQGSSLLRTELSERAGLMESSLERHLEYVKRRCYLYHIPFSCAMKYVINEEDDGTTKKLVCFLYYMERDMLFMQKILYEVYLLEAILTKKRSEKQELNIYDYFDKTKLDIFDSIVIHLKDLQDAPIREEDILYLAEEFEPCLLLKEERNAINHNLENIFTDSIRNANLTFHSIKQKSFSYTTLYLFPHPVLFSEQTNGELVFASYKKDVPPIVFKNRSEFESTIREYLSQEYSGNVAPSVLQDLLQVSSIGSFLKKAVRDTHKILKDTMGIDFLKLSENARYYLVACVMQSPLLDTRIFCACENLFDLYSMYHAFLQGVNVVEVYKNKVPLPLVDNVSMLVNAMYNKYHGKSLMDTCCLDCEQIIKLLYRNTYQNSPLQFANMEEMLLFTRNCLWEKEGLSRDSFTYGNITERLEIDLAFFKEHMAMLEKEVLFETDPAYRCDNIPSVKNSLDIIRSFSHDFQSDVEDVKQELEKKKQELHEQFHSLCDYEPQRIYEDTAFVLYKRMDTDLFLLNAIPLTEMIYYVSENGGLLGTFRFVENLSNQMEKEKWESLLSRSHCFLDENNQTAYLLYQNEQEHVSLFSDRNGMLLGMARL